ncbi:MAG: hypothetical protein KAR47_16965 [Planctomycetes bacterium]|nr:hypothetical protein [Planctomycetota bacterium]
MLEVLYNFERLGGQLSGRFLVAGGIFCLVVGLGVWLGGLRWSAIVAGIIAAAAGAACAMTATSQQAVAIASMTVVAGGFGMFFDKKTLALAAAVLTVAIVLISLAGPLSDDETEPVYAEIPIAPPPGQRLNVRESVEVVGDHALLLSKIIVRTARNASTATLAISAAASAVVLVTGLLFSRLVAALTCSLAGLVLILTAMTLLLMYKGAQPITFVRERVPLYHIAMLAILAFGTVAQLLLSPHKHNTKRPGPDQTGPGVE